MRKPSNNPITLAFGATTDPYTPANPHNGTDFSYQPDEKIYAPFSGKVILRPNNGNDGNGIYMYNGNQFHGMLHAQSYLVADGVQVFEGQPIGIMGETGYAFGRHCHWCVKVNNKFIDPMGLVEESNMPFVEQAVLDDYEAWKTTGQQLSFDPAYPAMGGKSGSPLVVVENGKVVAGDTKGIGIVLDDFRKNKEENLSKPPHPTQLKPGTYEVK